MFVTTASASVLPAKTCNDLHTVYHHYQISSIKHSPNREHNHASKILNPATKVRGIPQTDNNFYATLLSQSAKCTEAKTCKCFRLIGAKLGQVYMYFNFAFWEKCMQLVIMNPFFFVKYCVIPLLYSLQEKEGTMITIMKYNIPYTAVSRKVAEKNN